MNADLHMSDELKNTGKGNLFVIFGEPDIEIIPQSKEQIRCAKVNESTCSTFPGSQSDSADGIACWFIDTDYSRKASSSATPISSAQRPYS